MKNKILFFIFILVSISINAQVQTFNTKVRFTKVDQNNVVNKVAMLAEDGTLVFIPKDSIGGKIDDSLFIKKKEPNDAGSNFSLFTQDESSLDYSIFNNQLIQFSDSNVNKSVVVNKDEVSNQLLNQDGTSQGAYFTHNSMVFSEGDSNGVITGLHLNKNGFRYSNQSTTESFDVNLPKDNEGTLILSINGQKADVSGNIQLELPNPDLSNYVTKENFNYRTKTIYVIELDENRFVVEHTNLYPINNERILTIYLDGIMLSNELLPNGEYAYTLGNYDINNNQIITINPSLYTEGMTVSYTLDFTLNPLEL